MTINTDNERDQSIALFNILSRLYSPASVTDIGCNSGLYLEPFQAAGIDVMGYDSDPVALAKAKAPVQNHDITTPINRRSDMAICLEVMEHIPSEMSGKAMDTLCAVSDHIIFSAAIPGQGGQGHINCQPKSYWIEEFRKRGFYLCADETEAILSDLRPRPHIMGWLLNNLMVVRREGTAQKFIPLTFHVVSLPHTQTTAEYTPCAYTQKVRNFCRMMKSLGHTVYLHASEENDAPCDELITCIKKSEQNAGDWKRTFFNIPWTSDKEPWVTFNNRAIPSIAARIKPRDFICLIAGHCQKPIADAFPNNQAVEFGVGYEGTFAPYRVFESYAWTHCVYGKDKQGTGRNYDTVIPNYYNVAEFPFSAIKDDYFLFVGRMIVNKGPHVAAQICEKIGARLIMAGQGVTKKEPGKIISDEITVEGHHVEHIGTIDAKRRGELMSRARAVIVPTNYIGPFEGVHAEAMLCGTPVITTDWGVFSETVINGFNGFRFKTLGEGIWAAQNVSRLDYKAIRRYAISRFSMDVVKYQYDRYFRHLLNLWDKGWFTETPTPIPLDSRILEYDAEARSASAATLGCAAGSPSA